MSESWETQNVHWVCVGDDVRVNYNSADGYENISQQESQHVYEFSLVCYFKSPNFMNECALRMSVCDVQYEL